MEIFWDRPDENGIVYTKEAIKEAITSFQKEMPIVFRDNEKYPEGVVVGKTLEETISPLFDEEKKTCSFSVKGVFYFGGTACEVKINEENTVSKMQVLEVGISV